MVHAVCRRRLGRGVDADEAAQAVFVILARQARRVRDPGRIAAWLHATAIRTCAMSRRSRSRRERHEAGAAAQALATRPDPGGECGLEPATDPDPIGHRLDQAIAGLPERQRAAIIERYLAGGSYAEVGQRLGISADAAKKRVTAALARLRRSLGGPGGELGVVVLMSMLEPPAADAGGALAAIQRIHHIRPISHQAIRLAHQVRHMHLLHTLVRSILPALLLGAVLVGGFTWRAHAADRAAAEPPQRAAVFMSIYDVRDLVRGERWWWHAPFTRGLGPALKPVNIDQDAITLASLRSCPAMIAQLQRILAAASPVPSTVGLLYVGITDEDLRALLAPSAGPQALQPAAYADALEQLRTYTRIGFNPIPEASEGAWYLVITTTMAGYQRLEDVLRAARVVRSTPPPGSDPDWQAQAAAALQRLWRGLDATPPNPQATWPATGVPDTLATTSGPPLHLVSLHEVPRVAGGPMQPLVVAGGASVPGSLVVFTDGTVLWRPDQHLYDWAKRVRQGVDAGQISTPLTIDLLRDLRWPLPPAPKAAKTAGPSF